MATLEETIKALNLQGAYNPEVGAMTDAQREALFQSGIKSFAEEIPRYIQGYNTGAARQGLITSIPEAEQQKFLAEMTARQMYQFGGATQPLTPFFENFTRQFVKPFMGESSAPETLGLSPWEIQNQNQIPLTPEAQEALTGFSGKTGEQTQQQQQQQQQQKPLVLGNKVSEETSGEAGEEQQRTLIDIAQSRPDVMNTAIAQGGDPFTAGTKANTWLNDWWNTAGKNEYPDVDLVQPETQEFMEDYEDQRKNKINNKLQEKGAIPPTGEEEPMMAFSRMYKEMIEAMGFSDMNDKIKNIEDEYAEIQEKQRQEMEDVNDNPWISEGIRQKEMNKIQDRYESRLTSLGKRLATFKDIKDDMRLEAQFIANQAMDTYFRQATLDQQALLKKLELAERSIDTDTQVVEADGRKSLINMETGEVIADLGAAKTDMGFGTPSEISRVKQWLLTQPDFNAAVDLEAIESDPQVFAWALSQTEDKTEKQNIRAELEKGRNGGEHIDGNVYDRLRNESDMSFDQFNKQFGYLLSEDDQENFGVITQ